MSDDALVASLHRLCLHARRLDARVVAHLVEVEERRLHLKAACSSLFEFCVRRLGMSEGASYRRINAARLARRLPSLVAHIESGAVHLSTLVLLRDHLTESNAEELVSAMSGKTKRQVEELLACRAPRPDVPSRIRKLPAPAAVGSRAPAVGTSAPAAAVGSRAPAVGTSAPAAAVGSHALAVGTSAPAASVGSHALAVGTSASAAAVGSLFGDAPASSHAAPAPAPARVEPLSESRYKMQLTVSSELREKLERATDLLRHRNPSGDLARVVEQAFDALLEKLDKERLGKTSRPLRKARGTKPGRIGAAVRREVLARDGEQCTYVDERGHRCASRAFLELDHIESRALGGADDATNLRVACRAHNRLHAEQVFGRNCVERGIHFRQRRSGAARLA
jgi:5-methylcytosine-specific restriction endonuclease McrA